METKTINVPFEIKTTGTDGTFSGYGSVFGNEDSYGDIVARGAFKNSLEAHSEKGTMPALLWQHDPRTPVGVWEEMTEDENGLYVRGKLLKDDVQLAGEAFALLKAGALSGLSIGFQTKVSEYDQDNDVRILKELELWEVSLVTFPANDKARVVTVKSIEDIEKISHAERFLRESKGFTRKEATAFVSRLRNTLLRDSDAKAAIDSIRNLQRIISGDKHHGSRTEKRN